MQHEYLRPEFDELSDVAKIIYYDQRGCGKSEVTDSYAWQEHVKDLKRVINTLSQGKKVILAASSWGSLLAMIYAYTHPEDIEGLILSGTVEWPGEGVNVRDYKPSTNRDMVPYIERRKSADQRLIPVQTGDTISGPQFIAVHKEYEIRWGPGQFEPIHSFVTAPVLDSLRKITMPVLIFNAAREKCTYDWGERYGKIFPKAELFPIQGAWHSPWFTHPGEFFEKSKKFVLILNKNK